jgi:hypothetical protein
MPGISAPLVQQRKGISSQVIWIPELDGWDKDPATVNAFSMPLADKTSYKVHTDLIEAEIYDGTQLPPATVTGNSMADGSLNLGLEYTFLGRMMKCAVGANGYLQPEGATGKLKQFVIPTTPGSSPISGQVLRRSNESTAQIFRATGNFVNTIHFPFATSGRATYELGLIGSGREYPTLPAGFGSITNDGYNPANYFNMQMIINGYIVVGLTNFDDTLDFHCSRQDVGANSGYAGSVNVGYIGAGGQLGLIWSVDGAGVESNYNLQDMAKNEVEFAIDCVYANKPLNIATEFFRRRYWARLSRSSPDFGGNAGLIQDPKWQMVRSSAALWPAERIADNLGPFTLTGSNNVLGVKIDNGSTIPITFATGSVTVDAMVTACNAVGGFSAVAIADNYMGRLRITSKTTGSVTSKVQIDVATSNSAHTILGLTGTIYAGFGTSTVGCPMIYDNYNQLASSY